MLTMLPDLEFHELSFARSRTRPLYSERKAKIWYPVSGAPLYGVRHRERWRTHKKEVDATSLFDAADEVVRDWHRLWWWSSSSLIQIESGSDRWQVSQASVRKW
jgi:hypothetical protein